MRQKATCMIRTALSQVSIDWLNFDLAFPGAFTPVRKEAAYNNVKQSVKKIRTIAFEEWQRSKNIFSNKEKDKS